MARSKKFGGILGSSTAGAADAAGVTVQAAVNPFTVEQLFTLPASDNVSLISSLYWYRTDNLLYAVTYTNPCLLIRFNTPLTDLSNRTIFNLQSLLGGNGNLGVFGLDIGSTGPLAPTNNLLITTDTRNVGSTITGLNFNTSTGACTVAYNVSTSGPLGFGCLGLRGAALPAAFITNVSSPAVICRYTAFGVQKTPDIPTISPDFFQTSRTGGFAMQDYISSDAVPNFLSHNWLIVGGNQPGTPPSPGGPGTPTVAWIGTVALSDDTGGPWLYAQQVDLPVGDTLLGRRIAAASDKIFVALQHGMFGTGDILVYSLADIRNAPIRIRGASSANGAYFANGFVWVPTEADAVGAFGATLYRIDPATLAVSSLVLPTVGGGEHLFAFEATNGMGCAGIQVNAFHPTGTSPYFAAYRNTTPNSAIVRFH